MEKPSPTQVVSADIAAHESRSTDSATFHTDPYVYCLLVPHQHSPESAVALELAENQDTVKSVYVVDLGGKMDNRTFMRGHVVRIGDPDRQNSSFTIGRCLTNDVRLPHESVQDRQVELYVQSHRDTDTHYDFSVMLKSDLRGHVEVVDPFCEPHREDRTFIAETMTRSVRCINRLRLLKIGIFVYEVHYPESAADVVCKRNEVLRRAARSSSSDMDNSPRSLRFQGKIGRGGSGACHVVRSATTGIRYAVKEICLRDVEDVAKVLRPLHPVLQRRHINIMSPVHYAIVSNVRPCQSFGPAALYGADDAPWPYLELILKMYMPLFSASLTFVVSSGHNVSRVSWMSVIPGIISGLAHLHKLDIVHGALKPENVLLLPRPDGTMLLQLSDFVVARPTGSELELDDLHSVWHAPETLEDETITAASNIFSLALLFILVADPKGFVPAYHGSDVRKLTDGTFWLSMTFLVKRLRLGGLEPWILAMLSLRQAERPCAQDVGNAIGMHISGGCVPRLADVLGHASSPPYPITPKGSSPTGTMDGAHSTDARMTSAVLERVAFVRADQPHLRFGRASTATPSPFAGTHSSADVRCSSSSVPAAALIVAPTRSEQSARRTSSSEDPVEESP